MSTRHRKTNARKTSRGKTSRGRFAKGNPGGPGRKKGVPNKATAEARAFFRGVLEGADFQDRIRRRLMSARAPIRLLELAYAYAYGKPRQSLDIDAGGSLLELLETIAVSARSPSDPQP